MMFLLIFLFVINCKFEDSYKELNVLPSQTPYIKDSVQISYALTLGKDKNSNWDGKVKIKNLGGKSVFYTPGLVRFNDFALSLSEQVSFAKESNFFVEIYPKKKYDIDLIIRPKKYQQNENVYVIYNGLALYKPISPIKFEIISRKGLTIDYPFSFLSNNPSTQIFYKKKIGDLILNYGFGSLDIFRVLKGDVLRVLVIPSFGEPKLIFAKSDEVEPSIAVNKLDSTILNKKIKKIEFKLMKTLFEKITYGLFDDISDGCWYVIDGKVDGYYNIVIKRSPPEYDPTYKYINVIDSIIDSDQSFLFKCL